MRAADWLPGFGPRPRRRDRRPRGRRDVPPPRAEAWMLEERQLLSRLHADAAVPALRGSVARPADVFYDGPGVPLKTITITNNTDKMIYPFLEDANATEDLVKGSDYYGQSLYDPLDPYNQEYRGYIGYVGADGQDELGLRPHQSVTVQVPLVFWDGGRLDIATTDKDLTPDATQGAANNPPDPFNYYTFNAPLPGNVPSPTARVWAPAQGPAGAHDMVMWYHATVASGPANDAPFQLDEMTFRDTYLSTLPNAADIDDSQKTTLINYDVSYVDSITLPVAIEAADTALYPSEANSPHKAFGWIGSTKTYADMEGALEAFTSDDPTTNRLGQYFGGAQGYDKYYNPDEKGAGVKLPAGQNIIGESPLINVRSSYDNNEYALTSGGAGPVQVINGAFPDGSQTLKLVAAPPSDPDRLDGLKVGMTVTTSQPNIITTSTTITKVNRTDGKVTSVDLSSAAGDGDGASYVFTFTRPVADPVAAKITDLWYGWAQYYVTRNQGVATVPDVAGSTTSGSNILTLNTPVTGLVPGMLVTSAGAGIPATTTILAIDSSTSIELGRAATATGGGSFTFSAPPPIAGTDLVNPLSLSFTSTAAQAKADQFAQVVYSLMSAMSTATEGSGNAAYRLIYNVLGGNIGYIPNANAGLAGVYTNEVKSLLRGVYDYHAVPVSSGQWYPDPAKKTPDADVDGAAADFNVYNLNPFVWFVHEWLKLSGYGFSLDDDVADVGAAGANNLLVSVGGPGGLDNPVEWKAALPYGPVHSDTGSIAQGSTALTGLDRDVVAELVSADPNTGLVGATVTGPGIAPGTTVVSTVIGGTQVNLSKPAASAGTASSTDPYRFTA